MTNINRPWTRTVTQGGYTTTTTGTSIDFYEDGRIRNSAKKVGEWRPPTDYYRYIQHGYNRAFQTENSSTYTAWNGFNSYSYTGGYVGPVGYMPSLPVFPQELIDRITVKCLQRVKNQNVNLAQCFGERMQTARLVYDSCFRIGAAILALKRLDWQRAQQLLGVRGRRKIFRDLRRSANKGTPFAMWLELMYGWKPMLSDVYGTVKTLDEKEQVYNRARCSVEEYTASYSRLDGPVCSIEESSPYYKVQRLATLKCSASMRLDYELENPYLATLASLGLLNPLALGWELLPFSFVGDWFIPIGTYFNCLDATAGWSFKGGSVTTKMEEKSQAVQIGVPYTYNTPQAINTCNVYGKGRRFEIKRTALLSSPLPSAPHFNTRASSVHVANGIALLMAALTGIQTVR